MLIGTLAGLTRRCEFCLVWLYILEDHMKATVVDLRYHMNDVLKALDRNERVSILYHGRVKGVITANRCDRRTKVTTHPFFNMSRRKTSVDKQMDALRGGRHRDL